MTKDHNPDDLESQVGRELHHRVDGLHQAPLSLDDVKGRAGSIRRNRRLATAAGIVAAVAVIVPVAVLTGQNLGDDNGLPPASQSPHPSPTRATDSTGPSPTPSTSPEPSAGDLPTYSLLGDFPAGPAPAVPYLDGTRLVRPDQAPVELPRAYDTFALLGDRFVGTYSDDNADRMVDVVEADSTVSRSDPIVERIAVNDQSTTVAYGTPDGSIQTLWAEDGVELARDVGEPASVAAVRGDGSCYEVDGGCRVFFNSTTFGDPPRAADSHGIVDQFMNGAIKVNDVSPSGLIAVQTSSSDTGSCSGVYDEQERDFVFETCDNSLRRFSPDGGLLLASDAYGDGIGLGSLTVLDTATGDPLVKFEITGGFIGDEVWEDDAHLLVVTYEDVGWRVLRLGLDGTIAVVAGPESGADEERPFFLPMAP